MDALQSFVTTMEPNSDFTVKLEEQTGDEGNEYICMSTSNYTIILESSRGQRRKRPRVPPGPSHPTQQATQPPTSSSEPCTSYDLQCPECLQVPCIVEKPPTFLKGSGVADIGNVHKRYKLYRKFWSYLQKQGLWNEPRYLERKAAYTTTDDPREIMPWCVCQVKYQYIIMLL